MPTSKAEPSIVRGFQLPAQSLAKLDALAQQTGRTRASMLIYLITIAEPTRLPDIRLRAEPPHAPWAAQS
jgi:hypothetical protein